MGGTSFAPTKLWALATMALGVIADPLDPPLTNQEALSVRINMPEVEDTIALIVLSVPDTNVPVIASSARLGSEISKL